MLQARLDGGYTTGKPGVRAVLALEALQGERRSQHQLLASIPKALSGQLQKTSLASGRAGKPFSHSARSVLVKGKAPLRPALAPIPEHSGEEGRVRAGEIRGVYRPRGRLQLGLGRVLGGGQQRVKREKVVVALSARHGAPGAQAAAVPEARAVLALTSVPDAGTEAFLLGTGAGDPMVQEGAFVSCTETEATAVPSERGEAMPELSQAGAGSGEAIEGPEAGAGSEGATTARRLRP